MLPTNHQSLPQFYLFGFSVRFQLRFLNFHGWAGNLVGQTLFAGEVLKSIGTQLLEYLKMCEFLWDDSSLLASDGSSP